MKGDYAFLTDSTLRKKFIIDLGDVIERASFQIIAVAVHKEQHKQRYTTPKNPYELSMLFCMERLHKFLIHNGQAGKIISIHAEARGKNEDRELELEFRRICDNDARTVYSGTKFDKIDYQLRFLKKDSNSVGLQFADLLARPIGLKCIRPDQENKAFEILEKKFLCHPNGDYEGKGLKIFP